MRKFPAQSNPNLSLKLVLVCASIFDHDQTIRATLYVAASAVEAILRHGAFAC